MALQKFFSLAMLCEDGGRVVCNFVTALFLRQRQFDPHCLSEGDTTALIEVCSAVWNVSTSTPVKETSYDGFLVSRG